MKGRTQTLYWERIFQDELQQVELLKDYKTQTTGANLFGLSRKSLNDIFKVFIQYNHN